MASAPHPYLCPACHVVLRRIESTCPACRAGLAWLNHAVSSDDHTPLEALGDWSASGNDDVVARVYHESRGVLLQEVVFGARSEIALFLGNDAIHVKVDQSRSRAEIRWNDRDSEQSELPVVVSRMDFRVCVLRRHSVSISCRASGNFLKAPVAIPLSGSERVLRIGAAARLVGRRGVHIASPNLRPLHAFFAVDDAKNEHDDWVVAAGPKADVWVGRERVISRRLETGDIIRVGPYAWQYSRANRQLIPVDPIDAAALILRNASDRKGIVKIDSAVFGPGELIAITGPSGCGKSTLLDMVLHADRLVEPHSIVAVDGQNSEDADFRSGIGYVPQKNVHHDELTPTEVVGFSRRVFLSRFPDAGTPETSEVLDLVDLDQTQRRTRAADLSGGQRRRLQIATQLVRKARICILDEPTSGLDALREREVLLQLRALALRGATVLVAIHSQQTFDLFDRVITLDGGRIRSDTKPREAAEPTDRASPEQGQRPPVEHAVSQSSGEGVSGAVAADDNRLEQLLHRIPADRARQWRACLLREFQLMGNQLWWRVAIPLALIPACFALAIGVAIRATQLDLMGFLTVLSVIWLSASVSHQAISGERQIFEYERLLSLGTTPYALAKFVVYSLSAVIQVLVFVAVLIVVRATILSDTDGWFFYRPWRTLMWLLAVAVAGTSVGLLISAACGRFRRIAGILLPLAMLGQMVFSVEIAGNGDIYVDAAYEGFSLGQAAPSDAKSNKLWSEIVSDRLPILMSYATVSRYGDMGLRRFAYINPKYRDPESSNDGRWLFEAVTGLAGIVLLCGSLTVVFLLVPQRERM